MRYRGGAVGHKTTREETKCLSEDRDKLDKIAFVLESERRGEFYRENEDVEMDREDEDKDGDESNDEMEPYSTDNEEDETDSNSDDNMDTGVNLDSTPL